MPRLSFWIAVLVSGAVLCTGQIYYSGTAVGIYDEPGQTNGVDFEAVGSTLHYAEVTGMVPVAYCSGLGGVFQCNLLRSSSYLAIDYAPDNLAFHTKVLVLGSAANSIGITGTGYGADSISGDSYFETIWSSNTFFHFIGIQYGLPGEYLAGLGLTVLSRSGTNYGLVVARAQFSDGTTASASRRIDERAGLGDTFFGFRAPEGAGINRLDIVSETGLWLSFDDVVFLTSAPETSPRLSIRSTAAGSAEISWPANCNDYVLESTPTMSALAWTPLTNTVGIARDRFVVTIDSGEVRGFFRLRLRNQ